MVKFWQIQFNLFKHTANSHSLNLAFHVWHTHSLCEELWFGLLGAFSSENWTTWSLHTQNLCLLPSCSWSNRKTCWNMYQTISTFRFSPSSQIVVLLEPKNSQKQKICSFSLEQALQRVYTFVMQITRYYWYLWPTSLHHLCWFSCSKDNVFFLSVFALPWAKRINHISVLRWHVHRQIFFVLGISAKDRFYFWRCQKTQNFPVDFSTSFLLLPWSSQQDQRAVFAF